MSVSDIEAIGERFTRLEREVRLWKRTATATMVLLAALIAFGPITRMREARAADSFAKDLVVRSLALVDEKGTQRALLAVGIEAGGPMLAFYDEKRTLRAGLAVFKDGPGLVLADEKGTPRASLAVEKREPKLALYDEKGTVRAALGPGLGLYDENGTTRAGLAITKLGAAWGIYDEKGKLIWGAP